MAVNVFNSRLVIEVESFLHPSGFKNLHHSHRLTWSSHIVQISQLCSLMSILVLWPFYNDSLRSCGCLQPGVAAQSLTVFTYYHYPK